MFRMCLMHITMVALIMNSTYSAAADIRTLPTPPRYFQPPRGAAPLGHVAQGKAAEKGSEPKAAKKVVAEETEEPESAGPENLLQYVLARLVYSSTCFNTFSLAWVTQAGDRDQNTARDPKLLGALALTGLLLFFFAFRGASTDDTAMMPDGKKGSDAQRAVHVPERCERDPAAQHEHVAFPEPRADHRLQRSHTAPATYRAFQTVSTNDEGACAKKAGEGADGNKRRVSHEAARLLFRSPFVPPIMMGVRGVHVCTRACTACQCVHACMRVLVCQIVTEQITRDRSQDGSA